MSIKWILLVAVIGGVFGGFLEMKRQSNTAEAISDMERIFNDKAPWEVKPGLRVVSANADGLTLTLQMQTNISRERIQASASSFRENSQRSLCGLISRFGFHENMRVETSLSASDGRDVLSLDVVASDCS